MTNPHKGRTGLDRIVRAAGHSISGLRSARVTEGAFRQESALAAFLFPVSWWFGRNWLEIALPVIVVLLVSIVELLNSAIEATVDRMSLEVHRLARKPKDIASVAVFLSLTLFGGVWIATLWHRWSGG
jgi:diacylglycerol kinase (ATP)